jgi:hypothetical protein
MDQVGLVQRVGSWGIAGLESKNRAIFESQLDGRYRRSRRGIVLRIALRAKTWQSTEGWTIGLGFVASASEQVATTDASADRIACAGATWSTKS